MRPNSSTPSPAVSLRSLRLLGVISLIILLAALVTGVLIINAQKASGSQVPLAQIQQGEQLFTQGTDDAAACVVCHTLNGATLVGPSLQHIGTVGAERVPGLSAQDYIRASIINPTAYSVAGFESGTMAPNYAGVLEPAQVDALVVFLMTQK